ncbi:MAG: YbbR-like domain-containing protein [Dysgonomonas sp.]
MSNTKDIILQEVRSFFKKIQWKKILTFLFFILLALIFWLMQVWRQKFDSDLNIPVKYVNVPDSIIFENELPTNIVARIKEDGATIFRYYFTRSKDSLVVDIREIVNSTQERVIKDRSFEELIRTKLFNTTELLSYTPARLSYPYAILHQKKLPVIYDGYVSLASGHLLDGDMTLQPDSVLAYGSRSALDTLHYAHTLDDTLKNVTSGRRVLVVMREMKGVKFAPNSVELTIPVDEFNQKIVEVPVVCVNLPENLNIKFFPSSVKIPFFVGLKRYNQITAEDFKVIVNYNDIKDFKETSMPVRVTESPDYVQTKLPIPSEVEFVLEQK